MTCVRAAPPPAGTPPRAPPDDPPPGWVAVGSPRLTPTVRLSLSEATAAGGELLLEGDVLLARLVRPSHRGWRAAASRTAFAGETVAE